MPGKVANKQKSTGIFLFYGEYILGKGGCISINIIFFPQSAKVMEQAHDSLHARYELNCFFPWSLCAFQIYSGALTGQAMLKQTTTISTKNNIRCCLYQPCARDNIRSSWHGGAALPSPSHMCCDPRAFC